MAPEERSRIAKLAADRRWSGDGRQVVYVIGPEAGPQKIGIALRPALRVKELQTGNPAALKVSMEFDPTTLPAVRVERRAHWLLRDERLVGEWFNVTKEQAAAAIVAAHQELLEGIARADDEPAVIAPPISLRLGDERLAWIMVYAAERGITRHAAILELIDEGHRSLTGAVAAAAPIAEPVQVAAKRDAVKAKPFASRLKGEWKAP